MQDQVEHLRGEGASARDDTSASPRSDDPILGRLEQSLAVIAAEPTRIGGKKNPQQSSGPGGHFSASGMSINAFSRAVDTIAAKRSASSLATWRPTLVIS